MKRKELKTVIEELKQRMPAKSSKVRKYKQRTKQSRQNTIFDFNLKKMYLDFNGRGVRQNDVPNAEESKRLRVDISSVRKSRWHRHNREAECLKDIKNELANDKHHQERVILSLEKMKQCRKMSNWKAPQNDGV